MTRRALLKKLVARSLLVVGISSSCGSEKTTTYTLAEVTSCDDLSGLPESEVTKRKQLGYVETSPIDDNICGNCQLYLPPVEDAKCGGCQLFKGPVLEKGYCTYWAPRM